QPVARPGGRRPGRARDRGDADHPLARPGAVGRPPAWPAGREGEVVTLGALTQRLRRADFLDGLGIYVGAHEVALAHVVKRFFTVALRHARTYPLPPATHPGERRQAIAQAVLAFAGEQRVDTRRAYLCLPRTAAACNRVLLPAAARENLAQVLEYEIEHLVPLPRDQVYFDYSVRGLGEDRLEILLMCIPREIVRVHLEALEDAFVRPRGIVLTSTAIADYLAFCRGGTAAPIGLLIGSDEAVELALLKEGRLVASQLVPACRVATLLPALGAALDAVREGTVPVNLLPAEGRRGAEEGLSLATVVLVAVLGVLLLVWGGSALVKDELTRRHVRDELARVEPQVKEVKALQNEIEDLRHQV